MMKRNFGRFAEGGIVDEPEMFGDTSDTGMPSIAGADLPNSGIRNKSMGDVFPPKEKFTPQQFVRLWRKWPNGRRGTHVFVKAQNHSLFSQPSYTRKLKTYHHSAAV